MRTHASRQTRGEQTRAGKAECRVVTTLKDNESTAPPGLNPGSVPHAFSLPRTPPTSGSQQALPLWPQAPSLTPHTHSKLSRAPRPTPRPSESPMVLGPDLRTRAQSPRRPQSCLQRLPPPQSSSGARDPLTPPGSGPTAPARVLGPPRTG